MDSYVECPFTMNVVGSVLATIVLALMHLVPAPKALHETLDKNSFRSELEVVNRQRSAVVVQYLIICKKGSMRRSEILL